MLPGWEGIFEPAAMTWLTLSLAADVSPIGEAISSQRCLVTQVARGWSYSQENGWIVTPTLTLQPETYGQPGTEYVVPSGGSYSGTSPITESPFAPTSSTPSALIGIVDSAGGLALSADASTSTNPTWTVLSGITGTICDACFDRASAYYDESATDDFSLGLYVVTIDGTSVLVYYIGDVIAGSSVALLHEVTMDDSSSDTNARIENDPVLTGNVVVLWKDQTGIFCERSGDRGATWLSTAQVGDSISDTSNDDAALGLAVYNNEILAPGVSSGEYGLYKGSASGGSFTIVGGSTSYLGVAPSPCIVADEESTVTAYTTTVDTGSTSSGTDVTFDSGGFPTYTIGSNKLTTSESAVGNPGNCARGTAASVTAGDGPTLVVTITWTTPITLTGVDADFYYSASGATSYTSCTINATDGRTNGLGDARLMSFPLSAGGSPVINNGTWLTKSTSSTYSGADLTNLDEIQIIFYTNDANRTSYDMRLDNISISPTIDAVITGNDSALYRVDDVFNTPSWTDITPSGGGIPETPHALSVNRANSETLHLCTDTNAVKISLNQGGTWSNEETSSDKRVVIAMGDERATGTDTGLVTSSDGGDTETNRDGNIDAVSGGFGSAKRLIV